MIIAWLLLGLAAAGAFYWGVLLVRLSIMFVGAKSARDGLGMPLPDGSPLVSVIVPVHNEAQFIDRCARGLREQDYENLQLVFVLDRCTDRTAELLAPHAAADPRVVVVENESCPEDWSGKCHAAHGGAEHATGEWLLFTDADTAFEPRLARASIALAHAEDLALLSLLSTLTYDHSFEQIAQLAASIHLSILYPIHRVDRSRRPRPFANGQFLLFKRAWYERIGGHAALKDHLLEDIAAARMVDAQGGDTVVAFADGMLSCSMYESLAAFESGWKRIFIEACNRKPGRLRKWGWRTLAGGVLVPVVQVATLAGAAVAAMLGDPTLAAGMVLAVAVGVALQVTVLLRVARRTRAPFRTVLLYPLGSLVVGRVMLSAARDLQRGEPIVWGGKRYVLDPR